MLRNYLTIALRNLWKYKIYAFINIMGLAIGMAGVLLILLYVRHELSFDQHHTNKDRVYRLNLQATNPRTGEINQRAIGPYRLAKEMQVDFTDMDAILRIAPVGRESIVLNDETYVEEGVAFVDDNVFSVFNFRLQSGDPITALHEPFSLVLTDEVAKKYFGANDPIGQTLEIRGEQFSITGILEKEERNSMFDFNMLISMNSAEQVFSRIVLENWGEGYVETYVMIPEGLSPGAFDDRLAEFVDKNLQAWKNFSPKIVMQPFGKVYLNSQDVSSFFEGGDQTYVYAFSFIALFILLIACINFMNLSTARASLRAKEVGLRKVVGAMMRQLRMQFLSESTILSLLSLVFALGIVVVAIPLFNQVTDLEMKIGTVLTPEMVVISVLIAIGVGIIGGSYPAFILSGYRPIDVFSGMQQFGMKGSTLRRVLVGFQFAISIFLMVVTAIVLKQVNYCKNANLGYNKDQVIQFSTPLDLREQYDEFRTELLKNPKVLNAAGSSRVPPGSLSSSLRARPEGVPEDQQRGMQTVWTDYDFIETMGLEIISGRSFDRDFPADAREGFILNEAAVNSIGWTNETALNKTFGSSEIRDWNVGQWENRDGKVIGVLRDFHFENMKEKIVPTVYFIAPYMAWNYVIKISPDAIDGTLQHIEKVWKQFVPDGDFEYSFIDENFAQLYESEERQARIFGIFAGLAIFIACLGLIGLTSFTAEKKKKEIGIRKVLGATYSNLLILLSKEFTVLVLIAFLIGAPIAVLVMQSWLDGFAYTTKIGWQVFALVGCSSVVIAWLTMLYQTTRAAFTNPIEAIQRE